MTDIDHILLRPDTENFAACQTDMLLLLLARNTAPSSCADHGNNLVSHVED